MRKKDSIGKIEISNYLNGKEAKAAIEVLR